MRQTGLLLLETVSQEYQSRLTYNFQGIATAPRRITSSTPISPGESTG
jgi:hypothetical protein